MNGMHGTRVAALLAVLFMAMTTALPAAAQSLGVGGAADDSPKAAYSTVFFGSYEQDGNTENGPEPIEWLVLEDDGETMTLLSRYILYGIDQVRSDYLDVDFLDDAFRRMSRRRCFAQGAGKPTASWTGCALRSMARRRKRC